MKTPDENVQQKGNLPILRKSLLYCFLLVLFTAFTLPDSLAQAPSTELFKPNTTARTEKEVKAYLPFHTKSKMVSLEFVDGMAVMEGDIVLGSSHLYSGDFQLAVAIDGDTYRWQGGIIPYTIASGHPMKQAIMQAIQHIQEQTNLRLVPRSNQNDYVTFITGDGCWSRVGKSGGQQQINIGNCGFGSIVHEILHTAGMWHEQSRADRDDNITIQWDNIKPDKKHNFERHISDGIDIGEYDCNSLMHYSAFAFSRNGMPTITSTTCTTFGQRQGMSPGDVAAINKLYPVTVPKELTTSPWLIVSRHSGKAIDISGSRLTPKANVLQNQINNSESQKFRLQSAGAGYYYVLNIGSNLVLDVEGGNASPGTNVWQYAKNGSNAQKWRLLDAGNGYYFIRSKLGDLNLDVQGALKTNGANIRVASLKGGPAQMFRFQAARHTTPPKATYGKALELYWNGTRKDNFSAASSTGKNNAVRGKYKFVRVEGYVLNKPSSSEGQVVPLYLYYHATRQDNFTTASLQGIRAAEAGGYRKAGIEGYILRTVKAPYKHLYKPLWLYYHDARKDNFVTASAQGIRAAEAGGYRKVRIEGYVRKDNFTNLAPTTTGTFKN